MACRQLGFTGGVSAFSNVDEIMVNWTATPLFNAIQGITCNGTESRLMECTLDSSGSAGICTDVGFLGIVCTSESSPRDNALQSMPTLLISSIHKRGV